MLGGRCKRMLDLIVGGAALILSLPLWGVCALLIKCSGSGPVFFRQTRIGLYGLPFQMYKFRTMHVDAEADTGPVWASDHDPRVLPACRWMRRSHVDELPQLINVLKGQMSLVGPRPERLEIMLGFEGIDRFKILKRLDALPGITGLAQIHKGYDTDHEGFAEKLEYDLKYIDTYSCRKDLLILIKTLPKFSDKMAK